MSTLFRVEPHAASTPEVRVLRLYGSLFFGATAKLETIAANLPNGTRAVVLEAHRLISMDTSGLDALEQLHRTLERQGVRMILCDWTEQPRGLVQRSGFEEVVGAANLCPDLATAIEAGSRSG